MFIDGTDLFRLKKGEKTTAMIKTFDLIKSFFTTFRVTLKPLNFKLLDSVMQSAFFLFVGGART